MTVGGAQQLSIALATYQITTTLCAAARASLLREPLKLPVITQKTAGPMTVVVTLAVLTKNYLCPSGINIRLAN